MLFTTPLGAQFLPEQTLATGSAAAAPDVAAEGSNVYVIWQETVAGVGVIKFRRSTDEGVHFGEVLTLSGAGSSASLPRLAAAGADVYAVWQEAKPGEPPEIWFSRSTDGGASFAAAEDLSGAPSDATRPAVAAIGPAVYVVWQELIPNPAFARHQIHFRRSLDQGNSFAAIKPLSDLSLNAMEPAVAAAGSAVYVAWQGEATLGSRPDVFLVRSLDEGMNFLDPALNLSKGAGLVASEHPAVAAVGALVYVTWQSTMPLGPPQALFAFSTNQGEDFTSFPGNLAEAPGRPALVPRVAAAGSAFTFAWQEGEPEGRIRFRPLSLTGPGGFTFNSAPANLSSTEHARKPALALAGSRLCAVWQELPSAGDPQILFRRSSAPDGLAPSNLSASPNRHSVATGTAAAGSDIYFVWSEEMPGGSLDVLFRASFDGGRTFSEMVNLSDNLGLSTTPRVAVAGQAVFVVWVDDNGSETADILFRRTLDRGVTWDPPLGEKPLNLSLFPGAPARASRAPTLAAEGSEVYVAWEDESVNDCPRVFGRRSLDQGSVWDPPPALNPKPLAPLCTSACKVCAAFAPGLAAAGPSVHLAFKLRLPKEGAIFIAYCASQEEQLPVCNGLELDKFLVEEDDGPQLAAIGSSVHAVWSRGGEIRFRTRPLESFVIWEPPLTSDPAVLSPLASGSRSPSVAAAGQEVYVAWGQPRILLRRSLDAGTSFEPEKVVSLPLRPSVEGLVGPPWLAATGPDVYLSWDEVGSPQDLSHEAFLRSSTDEAATFCDDLDLSISLSGPTDAGIGQPVSYGVKVRGGGGCGVHRVPIIVDTPIQLDDVRWCRGPGCIPTEEGPLFDIVSLFSGDEISYTLIGTVAPDASGEIVVTASVSPPQPLFDADPGNNNAVIVTRIVVPPGTSAFCSEIEGSFVEGTTVTYVFILRNGGPMAQGDNPGPELVDVLPAGLTLAGASADQGTLTLGPNSVRWDGPIAVGQTVTIRVSAQVSAPVGTLLCNQATVSFDLDGDGTNESSRLSDDPHQPGEAEPCCFRVGTIATIPVLGPAGIAVLSAFLAGIALRQLARRRKQPRHH